MKNYIITLFATLLMMVACLPLPAAVDTGSKATQYVDQSIVLPDLPAIAFYSDISLSNKSTPVFIDTQIAPDLNVPVITVMVSAPPKYYYCGVDIETNKSFGVKDFWNWFQANGWWLATILLAISEGLGLTNKIESNGILNMLFNYLKKIAAKRPVT